MDIKLEHRALVLQALQNPKFKWRTVKGVSSETGLSADLVREILKVEGTNVVRSSIPSSDGEALFTTRRHFRSNTSPISIIWGALKNRAD